MRRWILPPAPIAVLLGATLAAQPNVEEQARRQMESGRDFFRAGRYSEALKDFQTVAEGYPNSRFADDALLAIAEYQLEIAHDAAAARTTAENLFRRYATADSAPMGYVIAGRATMELDPSPAGLDSALASFDRVPRLFPHSEAMAPALYYSGEVLRRARRPDLALDRLREVTVQFPRSIWAARAGLLEASLLVGTGEPLEAARVLQRITSRFPGSQEAAAAVDRNTILYRLHIRPDGRSAFVPAGEPLTGRSGRLRDMAGLALLPNGEVALAGRTGVLVMTRDGTLVRQAPATDPRQVTADSRGRLFIVQRAVVSRETDAGLRRSALTAVQSGQPRLLQEISAGALLSTGDLLVADRDLRGVARFAPDGKFKGIFATGRVRSMALGPSELVAMLSDESRDVTIADQDGKMRARIPARTADYDLDSAQDLAFDVLGYLYVLTREGVTIFTPDGRFALGFTPDGDALRRGRALAVDPAGRLYIYDDNQDRVIVFE
jgi:TolA-binding protein